MATKHYRDIDWKNDFTLGQINKSQYASTVKITGPGISLSTYAEGGVTIPFEPSSYSKDPEQKRLDLVMNIDTPELQQKLQQLNDFLLQGVIDRKDDLFDDDDIEARDIRRGFVQPFVSNNTSRATGKVYSPMLKGKLYTDGENAVQVYNLVGPGQMQLTRLSAIKRRCVALVHLSLDGIWIQPGCKWGAMLNIMTVCILKNTVKRNPIELFDFGDTTMTLVASDTKQQQDSVLLNPTAKRVKLSTG